MTEEMTTIQVFKSDAEVLKASLPHLRNDAWRVKELLSKYRIVRVTTLTPAGSDPDAESPIYMDVEKGKS